MAILNANRHHVGSFALALDDMTFFRADTRAACADPQHNAEWWFPNSEATNWQQARDICLGCPLLTGCREWAIEHAEQGVWGALTEWKRTRIRHEREAAA